jgi:multiple sugar transport system permease protein
MAVKQQMPRELSRPAAPVRQGRILAHWGRRLGAIPWLAPSTILILAMVIYPAVAMVVTSFQRFDSFGVIHGWAGLGNYRALFDEPALPHVLVNTATWVAVIVGLTVLISLALAQFLNKRFPGRRLVRWAVLVPWAASLLVTAIIWQYIFNYYYGYLNRVLMDLHVIGRPIAWYVDPATALWSLIAVGIIVSIPFTTYVFLAGLQSIPEELAEAARTDGAGNWRIYRRVTLPLLKPALITAVVLNIIYVFNGFPLIYVITGDLPGDQTDTTITFMYKIAFKTNLNVGESAALGVFNVAFILIVVLLYLRIGRWEDIGSAARPGRRGLLWLALSATAVVLAPVRRATAAISQIGWTRGTAAPSPATRTSRASRASRNPHARRRHIARKTWSKARPAALSVVGLVVALFFIAPYVVMLLSSFKDSNSLYASPAQYLPQPWDWQNWVQAFETIPLGSYFRVSLTITVAGTALVLLVSVPAAYYTARFRFRGRRAFLYLVLITQLFSPVALVIGIYREFVQFNLSNTLTSLILADSAFNMAFAIWILNAYFSSIPREIEEAARVDGLNGFQVLRKIMLPLAMPGVVTAVIFTFIAIWNEFVVAFTLVSSPGNLPFTVGLESFVGGYETRYQYMFVAGIIAIVPVVVLFACIERYLVSGLTAGSVK